MMNILSDILCCDFTFVDIVLLERKRVTPLFRLEERDKIKILEPRFLL